MQSNTVAQPPTDRSSHRTSYPPNTQASHGRLRYASPQELPSFPSLGLKQDSGAANTAASLGWARQKPFEHWKPDASVSASTAAMLAKDHKAAPLWEPEHDPAIHRSAMIAAGNAQKHHQSPQPSQSAWSNSAANMAFGAARRSPKPVRDEPRTATPPSMRAAKGATASKTRQRSKSSPLSTERTYPDRDKAAANALSAATIAHRPSMRIPSDEAGAVPYTTMDRQMYTSNPPVKPEVDEKRRADVLHASAVAMAKRMFDQQQRMIDTTKRSEIVRRSSFERHGGTGKSAAVEDETPRFPNLQEAAYRLAQERLAKLTEEHQKNREYQEYYGSTTAGAGSVGQRGSKLGSIRGKLSRRRSSSDGDLLEDRRQSQVIRKQMSMFSSNLSKVDEQKRARDREALLAAAQRNVRAKLDGMDRKLYEEKGRVTSSKLSEWETKAHAAAQARSETRRAADNGDKINLGAGKFIDRKEVDAIAARRVQPVIDDINERAEAERERRLAAQMDEERRKEQAAKEKAREKEVQTIHKQLKEQEKAEQKERKAEIEQAAKAKKEEEKAAKAEQKLIAKEQKAQAKEEKAHAKDEAREQKAHAKEEAKEQKEHAKEEAKEQKTHAKEEEKEQKAHAKEEAEEDKALVPEEHQPSEEQTSKEHSRHIPVVSKLRKRKSNEDIHPAQDKSNTTPALVSKSQTEQIAPSKEGRRRSLTAVAFTKQRRESSPPLDEEPASPTTKMRNWFRSRFSRPRSTSAGATGAEDDKDRRKRNPGAFVGGVRLQRADGGSPSTASSASLAGDAGSMREVAMAKATDMPRPPAIVVDDGGEPSSAAEPRASVISSVSSDEDFVEAEEGGLSAPPPPPAIGWRDKEAVASAGSGSERRSGSTTRSGPRTSRFAENID